MNRDIRNGTGHALPTVNNNDFFIYIKLILLSPIILLMILINLSLVSKLILTFYSS